MVTSLIQNCNPVSVSMKKPFWILFVLCIFYLLVLVWLDLVLLSTGPNSVPTFSSSPISFLPRAGAGSCLWSAQGAGFLFCLSLFQVTGSFIFLLPSLDSPFLPSVAALLFRRRSWGPYCSSRLFLSLLFSAVLLRSRE
jgi:hypothetical protein